MHDGESLSAVANEMHAKGVIASALAFDIDTTLFGSFSGRCRFLRDRTRFVVLPRAFGLQFGPPNVVAVDVPRDRPCTKWPSNSSPRAKATPSVTSSSTVRPPTHTRALSHRSGSLEGLIGTGEYIIRAGGVAGHSSPRRWRSDSSKQAASVGLTPSTTLNRDSNAYQLVIAASIVEKEGYYPVNMPKVARVIYNRLARGGPLQMDATVLYYLGKDGGTVTPTMLQTQEPYNTYLNTGLTPTPICAVSTIALRATLHPPAGTWLYFTLINEDGQMAFSTTFAQQLREEKLAESQRDRMNWRLGVAGSPIDALAHAPAARGRAWPWRVSRDRRDGSNWAPRTRPN